MDSMQIIAHFLFPLVTSAQYVNVDLWKDRYSQANRSKFNLLFPNSYEREINCCSFMNMLPFTPIYEPGAAHTSPYQSINQSINEFIRFQNKVTKLYKKKLKLNRISTITKYNNLYNIVLLY